MRPSPDLRHVRQTEKFPQFANFFAYMAYPKRASDMPAATPKGQSRVQVEIFDLSPDRADYTRPGTGTGTNRDT